MRKIALTMVVGLVLAVSARAAFQSYVIQGHSMEPALQDAQHLLVEKLSYRFHPPRKDDIVILRSPEETIQGHLVKRVFALPGETVEVRDDEIVLCPDGQCPPVDKPPGLTIRIGPREDPVRIEVPPDQFFVMGDNREGSTDSRTFGPVPRGNIVGKAWLSVWPPSQMGVVGGATLQAQE